jgi:hypothetical protein
MSLSYEKLDVVQVRDPRTIIHNKRDYACLRGGSQVSYKAFTTNSVSGSSIQFTCPPPSGSIIVDRKVYFELPIRLTLTSDAANSFILAGQDAPRAFPLSSIIDTLQVTVNNTSVSINMGDIIQPLLHYNTDIKLKKSDYSMTPTYQDQSQTYQDLALVQNNRNPLGMYGDGGDEQVEKRGGFPFVVVSQNNTSGTWTAVIDMIISEPLFLSPFYFGCGNGSGFINVNTMDFNFTFVNNAFTRLWSHMTANTFAAPTNKITGGSTTFNSFGAPGFSFALNQPQLVFTYITPNEMQLINALQPTTYPYFDITRFPTDQGPISYLSGGTDINSNNIQLNSIPRRMYVFARASNAALQSTALSLAPQPPGAPTPGVNQGACTLTDTFYTINSISINFNNFSGLLSSASQRQLYEMSIKNHCNMSWNEWSGGPVQQVNSGTAFPLGKGLANGLFGTIGSVLCIEFGTDIGLNDFEAPGLQGQYQLQLKMNVSNPDVTGYHDLCPITMYIIIVSEGTFTIEKLGASMTQLGVISKSDILNAQHKPGINYHDIQHVNGGNFLDGLKNFGHKILSGIKEAIPYIADAAGKVAPYLTPLLFGLGEGEGGVMVGGEGGGPLGMGVSAGKMISRKHMRRHLR